MQIASSTKRLIKRLRDVCKIRCNNSRSCKFKCLNKGLTCVHRICSIKGQTRLEVYLFYSISSHDMLLFKQWFYRERNVRNLKAKLWNILQYKTVKIFSTHSIILHNYCVILNKTHILNNQMKYRNVQIWKSNKKYLNWKRVLNKFVKFMSHG